MGIILMMSCMLNNNFVVVNYHDFPDNIKVVSNI